MTRCRHLNLFSGLRQSNETGKTFADTDNISERYPGVKLHFLKGIIIALKGINGSHVTITLPFSCLPQCTKPSSSARRSNVTDHSDIQRKASLRAKELFLQTWSSIWYSTPQEKIMSIPQVNLPLQARHGKQRLLSPPSESWRA